MSRGGSGEDSRASDEPAPRLTARPTAKGVRPDDGGDHRSRSAERALLAWLQREDEEPPSGVDEQTLQGMRVGFDASGRYGATFEDSTVARERRARRLLRQYAAGDHAAALATAERMLRDDPEDRDAAGYAAVCRARLEATHVEALGGRMAVLRLSAAGPIPKALEDDPRTALLAELLQRGIPIGEILDLHSARRLDILLVIVKLASTGALARR